MRAGAAGRWPEFAEGLADGFDGGVEAAVDGGLGGVECLGEVALAAVLEEVLDDEGALVGREGEDGVVDFGGEGLPFFLGEEVGVGIFGVGRWG